MSSVSDEAKTRIYTNLIGNALKNPAGALSDVEIMTRIQTKDIVCVHPKGYNTIFDHASLLVTLGENYWKQYEKDEGSIYHPDTFVNPFAAKEVWDRLHQAESLEAYPVSKHYGGRGVMRFDKHPIIKPDIFDEHKKYITIGPNQNILAHTAEFVFIRGNIIGLFKPIEKLTRCNITVSNDNDLLNLGRLTLTIRNNNDFTVILPVDETIGRIIFFHSGQHFDTLMKNHGDTTKEVEEACRAWTPDQMLP